MCLCVQRFNDIRASATLTMPGDSTPLKSYFQGLLLEDYPSGVALRDINIVCDNATVPSEALRRKGQHQERKSLEDILLMTPKRRPKEGYAAIMSEKEICPSPEINDCTFQPAATTCYNSDHVSRNKNAAGVASRVAPSNNTTRRRNLLSIRKKDHDNESRRPFSAYRRQGNPTTSREALSPSSSPRSVMASVLSPRSARWRPSSTPRKHNSDSALMFPRRLESPRGDKYYFKLNE